MSNEVMTKPLEGHVMPPEELWIDKAAAIICGHPFIIERLFNAEYPEFVQFVREVLQTTAPRDC